MSGASEPARYVLQGQDCTVVLEADGGGALLWRHWGPKLAGLPGEHAGASAAGDIDHGALAIGPSARESRALPSFTLDAHPPLSLCPTFGLGWYAHPALLAHRGAIDYAQCFTACRAEWRRPGSALDVHLADSTAQLEVSLRIALDPDSDVLTLSSTLCNRGQQTLDLQWLAAATLPLPAASASLRSYSGRHNREFVLCEEALGRGQWRRDNRRGLTSHDSFPGAVVLAPGASAHEGVCHAAQLAWSGNHTQLIEWLDDGRRQWQLGEWLAPGELSLPPGARYSTPEVLATCSSRGLNGVAGNFHRAVRARLRWPNGKMRPRPVHLNTWEGYYFQHDLAALKRLADAAADVGIERFVLDDGWFHRRDDDTRGLGDWWADERKYPDGLAPLAAHVRARGMEFGLWVEPEMVNPDSELHRAHPDWALQLAGRPLLTARNQLALDLSRAEVRDYLYERLHTLLDALPVGYLKWDHNRDLAPAANAAGRASYHAQVLGAYALFERVRAAHPAVEIEACAGGGGRIDAGILQYTHRFWVSDCIDAVTRLELQPGFLQFFPPELLGAHIGASPAHSTSRSQSLAFRAAVATPGHLGLELDLCRLDHAERALLAEWVALYKQWRGLLHAGLWRAEAGDSVQWLAQGHAQELLLWVYRLQPAQWRYTPALALPFVAAEPRYRVQQLRLPGAAVAGTSAVWAPTQAWGGREVLSLDGSWLARVGLPLPPMPAECALLFHIEMQ